MKMDKIAVPENQWIRETARICGDVTVGCAEAAGVLEVALDSADWLKSRHAELTELTLRLDSDIADAHAIDENRHEAEHDLSGQFQARRYRRAVVDRAERQQPHSSDQEADIACAMEGLTDLGVHHGPEGQGG